jgi:hypothetical protein
MCLMNHIVAARHCGTRKARLRRPHITMCQVDCICQHPGMHTGFKTLQNTGAAHVTSPSDLPSPSVHLSQRVPRSNRHHTHRLTLPLNTAATTAQKHAEMLQMAPGHLTTCTIHILSRLSNSSSHRYTPLDKAAAISEKAPSTLHTSHPVTRPVRPPSPRPAPTAPYTPDTPTA